VFKLASDKHRAEYVILRQLVFPPANGQVSSKWFAVIEICSDNRSFEIKA